MAAKITKAVKASNAAKKAKEIKATRASKAALKYEYKQKNLELIAALIDTYDRPIRKRKLSNLDALACIMFMNETSLSYRKLTCTKYLKDCDYSTLAKRFIHWNDNQILEKVWIDVTREYGKDRLNKDAKAFKTIFIDTTMVKNDLGQDCVGRNPTDRGRLGSKISVIVDMNRVPLAITFYGANRNDIKTIEPTLDAIPFSLTNDNRRSTDIVGDKGYSYESYKIRIWSERRMRLVTEFKKTKKCPEGKPLSKQDQALIRKRYRMENHFGALKKSYRRCQIRRERYLDNFAGMVFLASSNMTLTIMSEIVGDHFP